MSETRQAQKDGRMLTISEAAAELGVTPRTLQRWEEAGLIRSERTLGGHRRYPIQEIERVQAAAKARSGWRAS